MSADFDVDTFIANSINDEKGLTEKEIVWKRLSETGQKVFNIDVGGLSLGQAQEVINRLWSRDVS